MNSPEPSRPGTARAPASGLKLMLAIMTVFLLLAGYGRWELSRRSATLRATIIPEPAQPAPNASASPQVKQP